MLLGVPSRRSISERHVYISNHKCGVVETTHPEGDREMYSPLLQLSPEVTRIVMVMRASSNSKTPASKSGNGGASPPAFAKLYTRYQQETNTCHNRARAYKLGTTNLWITARKCFTQCRTEIGSPVKTNSYAAYLLSKWSCLINRQLDTFFRSWHLTSASIGKWLEFKRTTPQRRLRCLRPRKECEEEINHIDFRRSRTWKGANISIAARMWITESSKDRMKCLRDAKPHLHFDSVDKVKSTRPTSDLPNVLQQSLMEYCI